MPFDMLCRAMVEVCLYLGHIQVVMVGGGHLEPVSASVSVLDADSCLYLYRGRPSAAVIN
jgi:hypothetical protein